MIKFKDTFNFSKLSIGTHLQIYAFLLVLITGFLMIYIYIVSEYNQLKQSNLKHLEQTMAVQQLAVENWLQDNSDKIKTLSASRAVREQDVEHMKDEFHTLVKNQKDIYNISYVNKNGIVEFDAAWEAGSDISEREYFQESMRGKDAISDVFIGRFSGIPIIIFSSPARDEKGEIYGAIVGVMKLTMITGLLEQFRFGGTGETYLVNREGLMLTESRFTIYLKEKGHVGKSTILQYQIPTPDLQNALKSGAGTGLYTDYRGQEVLGTYRQINNDRWILIGKIDKKEVLQQADAQLSFMALGFLAIVILALPLSWLMTRRLARPLRIFSKGAATIQQGNYDYQLSAKDFVHSPLELHQLSVVFNEMALKIQETMKGFQQTNVSLREAEEKYRSLIENFVIGVYVLQGTTIVYVNQYFVATSGYGMQELIGRDIFDFILPEDHKTVADNMTLRMAPKKKSVHYEFRGLKKDGTVIYLEAMGRLYLQGNKAVIMGTLIDITQRKRAEAILKQSHDQLERRVRERTQELQDLNASLYLQIQERLNAERKLCKSEATNKALLNSIPDLILRVRGDGYCLSAKPPAGGSEIGNGFKKIAGRNVSAIFSVEEAARFSKYMKQALATREPQCHEFEITINNDIRHFEHRISVCGENEVLVMVRDITEEKSAQLEMIEARDKLAQVERLSTLATIASGIAHEINQPLNAIKVTADSLLFMQQTDTVLAPEEIYQDLSRISSQVDRINNIIQHIRSFVHQRSVVSLEPVALSVVLAGARSLLEQQMKRKRIKLIMDIPPTLPLIQGNLIPLEEVFVNLLANAMQALDAVNIQDKQVAVKAWYKKDVVIEVSDNGPGISEEIKDKVFEPFYTTKAGYNGMGLGLSIVKSIIVAYGGKIDIVPSYMGGATFRIVVPVFDNHLTMGGTSNENIIG